MNPVKVADGPAAVLTKVCGVTEFPVIIWLVGLKPRQK